MMTFNKSDLVQWNVDIKEIEDTIGIYTARYTWFDFFSSVLLSTPDWTSDLSSTKTIAEVLMNPTENTDLLIEFLNPTGNPDSPHVGALGVEPYDDFNNTLQGGFNPFFDPSMALYCPLSILGYSFVNVLLFNIQEHRLCCWNV